MTTDRTLLPLAALGLLWATAASGAAVDTSNWKCELCPFEKDGTVSASVEVGVGAVSDDSKRYGDYTGLDRKGAHAVVGGGLRWRGADGLYGSAQASDLGLDTRALGAELAREGQFTLRIGYSEIPRHLAEGASSPFLGIGGNVLTLPAGYPAPSTGTMPLAATLRPVDVSSKRSRLDAGISWSFSPEWSARLSARHDVRDGLQRTTGSFFANAAQLLAPLDQTTDQVDASASFTSGRLHASVGYHGSLFRNGTDALTWTHPFSAGDAGATRGQLALAPDNQFHQVMAAAGFDVTPSVRISGDMSFGQMTQDASFLAASLNPQLAVRLPASSLDGQVDVFNANARVSATPAEGLTLTATYARDVHDNRTTSLAWPAVSTDLYLGSTPRSNQPFSFATDRVRLSGEYRFNPRVRAAFGADHDRRDRTLQDVVTTREATLWARLNARPLDALALSVKLAHGERDHTAYGSATWVDPAQSPLLRKFNLAARNRSIVQTRADATLADNVSLGVSLDYALDDYGGSPVGLTEARNLALGADLSVALDDDTQLHVFAHGDRIRSAQSGSQSGLQPDWRAHTRDVVNVLGVGFKHMALKGKLELGADLTLSQARSDVTVEAGAADPAFPSARTYVDGVRLYASWKLQDSITLVGSWWYEDYRSRDWHLDGVTPQAVSNLLTLGDLPPRQRLNVLRVALRYRF